VVKDHFDVRRTMPILRAGVAIIDRHGGVSRKILLVMFSKNNH